MSDEHDDATPQGPSGQAIARLVAGRELLDEGNFSIDGDAARTKLASRQLADPDAWILLVVEAAELVGSIDIRLRERVIGLRVTLEGPGVSELLGPDEAEQLFSWVFESTAGLGEDERKRVEARQLLALALNALTARDDARVKLAIRGPGGGRRLSFLGRAAPVHRSSAAGPPRITLERFDARTRLRQLRPESRRLIARAGYGRCPIFIDGQRLPAKPELGRRRGARVIELDGEPIGRTWVLHQPIEPRLLLVTNGVELETLVLPGFAWGFVALVTDTAERDLSLGRAIRGPAHEAIMASVRRVHDELVAHLREAGAPPEALARWQGARDRAPAASAGTTEAIGEASDPDLGSRAATPVALIGAGLVIFAINIGAWVPLLGAGLVACAAAGLHVRELRARAIRKREIG